MRQKSGPSTEAPEKVVKDIRRATRKRHSPEEKIRIVLSGLNRHGLDEWRRAGFHFRLEWLLRNINAIVTGDARPNSRPDSDRLALC